MLLFATSVLPWQADRTDGGVGQPRRLWGLHLSAGGLWDLQNVDLLLQDAQLVRGAAVDSQPLVGLRARARIVHDAAHMTSALTWPFFADCAPLNVPASVLIGSVLDEGVLVNFTSKHMRGRVSTGRKKRKGWEEHTSVRR